MCSVIGSDQIEEFFEQFFLTAAGFTGFERFSTIDNRPNYIKEVQY